MGFCYQGNLLVCDVCCTAGARKVPCPAGWCQAVAMCPGCRKSPEVKAKLVEYHAGCADASARYAAERAKVDAVLATGAHVFCASVYADRARETVRCTFRSASGATKDLVLTKAERDELTTASTYEALAGLAASS